jgi:hypothetical protein
MRVTSGIKERKKPFFFFLKNNQTETRKKTVQGHHIKPTYISATTSITYRAPSRMGKDCNFGLCARMSTRLLRLVYVASCDTIMAVVELDTCLQVYCRML